MPPAPVPTNELDRLRALVCCDVLDTDPEPGFDDLTALAAALCETPIALVSLVDRDRQWFKSTVGLEARQTHRDAAFCGYAILGNGTLVIPDASVDPRTRDNPLVLGEPHIRFYAGAPLMSHDGLALGTLCVIDIEPRQLTDPQLDALRRLASQASAQLELRRAHAEALEREHQTVRLADRLRRTGSLARVGGWELDIATQELRWSDEVCRIHDVAPGTPISVREAVDFYAPEARPLVEAAVRNGLERGIPWDLELPLITASGRRIWVHARGEVEHREDGATKLIGAFQDITDRKQHELATREVTERFRSLAAQAPVGIFETDARGVCVYVNERWSELTGLGMTQARGEGWTDALHPGDAAQVADAWIRFTSDDEPFRKDYRFQRPDDTVVWVSGRAVALRDTDNAVTGYLGTVEDITDRKRLEAHLERSATHDALTGLPNRALLHDRLRGCLERARRRPDYNFALLYLDFDRFKFVNDTLGHDAGDELLKGIADRLGDALRATDTAARLGGDEFAVVLDDLRSPEDASTVAATLLELFREPHRIGTNDVVSTASIGLVTSRTGVESPEEMLREADAAMYEAKLAGKCRCVEFDGTMRGKVRERLTLENDLRGAHHNHDLRIAFQPIVSIDTGRWVGAEALLRWSRPDGTQVEPLTIIEVAEDTGLMVDIGDEIFTQSCRALAGWRERLGADAPETVSVNLSRVQLGRPDLCERFTEIVSAMGLQPKDFCLDFTERSVLSGRVDLRSAIEKLRQAGFVLTLDDFGTGVSSLTALRELPIDALKIDHGFVAGLGAHRESIALAHAAIQFADNLGLVTVAEGVETPEQLALLSSLGCQLAQGHLFARPLDADAFVDAARASRAA